MFLVPYKRQPFFAGIPVDEKHITWPHLHRGQQPRNRADQIAFDGAVQVAGTVSLIGALFEQELSSLVRYSEREGARCRIRYALLYLPQLDLQHFIKFVTFQ